MYYRTKIITSLNDKFGLYEILISYKSLFVQHIKYTCWIRFSFLITHCIDSEMPIKVCMGWQISTHQNFQQRIIILIHEYFLETNFTCKVTTLTLKMLTSLSLPTNLQVTELCFTFGIDICIYCKPRQASS